MLFVKSLRWRCPSRHQTARCQGHYTQLKWIYILYRLYKSIHIKMLQNICQVCSVHLCAAMVLGLASWVWFRLELCPSKNVEITPWQASLKRCQTIPLHPKWLLVCLWNTFDFWREKLRCQLIHPFLVGVIHGQHKNWWQGTWENWIRVLVSSNWVVDVELWHVT